MTKSLYSKFILSRYYFFSENMALRKKKTSERKLNEGALVCYFHRYQRRQLCSVRHAKTFSIFKETSDDNLQISNLCCVFEQISLLCCVFCSFLSLMFSRHVSIFLCKALYVETLKEYLIFLDPLHDMLLPILRLFSIYIFGCSLFVFFFSFLICYSSNYLLFNVKHRLKFQIHLRFSILYFVQPFVFPLGVYLRQAFMAGCFSCHQPYLFLK